MVDELGAGLAAVRSHANEGQAFRLPLGCRVEYHAHFLSAAECRDIYEFLDGIPELKDRRFIDVNQRETVVDTGRYMLADPDLLGFDKLPAVWGGRSAWPPCIEPVKHRIESAAGAQFQVCRCLHYESGEVGADFHADLPAYGSTDVIASISLGDEREFVFRNIQNHGDQYSLVLRSGSLLIMGEGCQDQYEHSLPVSGGVRRPRFNLTFRRFGWKP